MPELTISQERARSVGRVLAFVLCANWAVALLKLGFGLWAGQEDDPMMVDELRSLLKTALTPDA